MYLGIEIGGTKLQLGVSERVGELLALERRAVDVGAGAKGILEQIERVGCELRQRYAVERIGIGFGGPVDAANGVVTESHQVAGWEGVPLVAWCEQHLGVPATLCNDCDAAALAESAGGAGREKSTVFYVTVGTGIGGGFVVDGRLHGAVRPAAAEIGQLRTSLDADSPSQTVESLACGPAIESWLRSQVSAASTTADAVALLERCQGDLESLRTPEIAEAAAGGNALATAALDRATTALGWGIAQVVTLLAPEVIVVGGGVSLIGESLFFAPLRTSVTRFVFPPLASSYEIRPAALGEEVVVHGAVALAARSATL